MNAIIKTISLATILLSISATQATVSHASHRDKNREIFQKNYDSYISLVRGRDRNLEEIRGLEDNIFRNQQIQALADQRIQQLQQQYDYTPNEETRMHLENIRGTIKPTLAKQNMELECGLHCARQVAETWEQRLWTARIARS